MQSQGHIPDIARGWSDDAVLIAENSSHGLSRVCFRSLWRDGVEPLISRAPFLSLAGLKVNLELVHHKQKGVWNGLWDAGPRRRLRL